MFLRKSNRLRSLCELRRIFQGCFTIQLSRFLCVALSSDNSDRLSLRCLLVNNFFQKNFAHRISAGAKNIIANGLYSVNNILCENIVFFYGCLDVVPMRKTTSKYCYYINIEETHFPQSEIPPTDLMPCPELKILYKRKHRPPKSLRKFQKAYPKTG